MHRFQALHSVVMAAAISVAVTLAVGRARVATDQRRCAADQLGEVGQPVTNERSDAPRVTGDPPQQPGLARRPGNNDAPARAGEDARGVTCEGFG